MIERMFDSDTDNHTAVLPDLPELTAEEWEAEERLIFELMDAGLEPALLTSLWCCRRISESWPTDVRLAVLLSA
jgi:hypothetical protein